MTYGGLLLSMEMRRNVVIVDVLMFGMMFVFAIVYMILDRHNDSKYE